MFGGTIKPRQQVSVPCLPAKETSNNDRKFEHQLHKHSPWKVELQHGHSHQTNIPKLEINFSVIPSSIFSPLTVAFIPSWEVRLRQECERFVKVLKLEINFIETEFTEPCCRE